MLGQVHTRLVCKACGDVKEVTSDGYVNLRCSACGGTLAKIQRPVVVKKGVKSGGTSKAKK